MSSVEAIEQQIKKLSPAELAELGTWFAEFASDAWDAQIEQDAEAGKLDQLAANALKEFKAGLTSEL